MSRRKQNLVQQLEKGAAEIIHFYRSRTPEELEIQVYTDDPGWTIRQVLAHLVTIERSMHWLFRDILTGGPGSPADFDVDRFNRTQPQKLGGLTLEELIAQFETVRKETLDIVHAMTEADLDREGRHAFHGHGKLERFIHWAHEHARIHQDDMRKVL